MISMRGLTVPLLLALAVPAQAATVAVTAPVNNGVDPKIVLGAHQLIASELDFQEGIEGVTDLEEMPPSLNAACLNSNACLKGITSSAGTNWLVTGQITAEGSQVALDLLLFDGSQTVRRKTWRVENDATALANGMTPILKELLTGENPNAAGGGAAVAGDFSSDEGDEFAFEDDSGGGGGGAAVAAGGGLTGDPEVDALMDMDSLDDIDEESERNAAGAAVVAAPAAAGAAAAGAAAGAASNATGGALSDEDVLSMISFGGGGMGGGGGAASAAAAASPVPVPAPVVAAATNPSAAAGMAQGAANNAIDNAVANNVPQTGNAMADKAIGGAAAAAASAAKGLIDLDAKEKKGSVIRDNDSETVNITARAGYSTYYKFQFVTGGAEVGVAPLPVPLNFVLGIEVYNVQRTLPPDIQVQTGQIFEWNQIFPLNAGLLYRIDTGSNLRPYIGADGILVQYYRDEVGGDWAAGPRARGGVDYFFNQNFGLNVNVAAGLWVGQNWPLIEPGVGQSGLLPQVSAGAVAAF